jgi:hypothetical protein
MFFFADTKKTSSSASMTVSPSGTTGAVLAEDGRDPGLHARTNPAQVPQLAADEGAAVIGADAHEGDPAPGEIQHLERTRMFDQALDLAGDDLLRRDQHVHGNGIAPEQSRMLVVVPCPCTRDPSLHVEQGRGDLAGHHVDLVRVGHGDQHRRIAGASRLQDRRIRAEADQHIHPQIRLQGLQALPVAVDHRDLVSIGTQGLGQRITHLSGTENDDLLHENPVPGSMPSPPLRDAPGIMMPG